MIVLNGEPFTRYNLRSLYPWAHQIIVVEGACNTSKAVASTDGHSIDGTLEVLRCFQAEEDFEHKVIVVSALDEGFQDGYWPEKTEMCQAFAKRATGNYLWQVDSDEFYREEDMPLIIKLLEDGVGQISFQQKSFWGGNQYVNNSIFLAEFGLRGIPRVFAWDKGHQYISHRPATVVDAKHTTVRTRGYISSRKSGGLGIYMYHYCLVFPSQVLTKIGYYGVDSSSKNEQGGGFNSTIISWHESNFKQIRRPFRLHNVSGYLSWIRPFRGSQPEQVVKMMADIRSGLLPVELRQSADIETLMRSRYYQIVTLALDVMVALATSTIGYPFYFIGRRVYNRLKKRLPMCTDAKSR